MVPRLGALPDSPFPPVRDALSEPDGLLAWGGGLEPTRLLNAYRDGIFPWFGADQPILWWSPSRRCVLSPPGIHVSRRLARTIRQCRFRVTADMAFEKVVAGCARPQRGRESTWITPEMAGAYGELHRMGYAHSVEVWHENTLAGGIYGLSLGRMFFGESMFSAAPDASKIAMVSLCGLLARWSFRWLDCQLYNSHLARMGAVEIDRDAFIRDLREGLAAPDRQGPWSGHLDPAPPTGRKSE